MNHRVLPTFLAMGLFILFQTHALFGQPLQAPLPKVFEWIGPVAAVSFDGTILAGEGSINIEHHMRLMHVASAREQFTIKRKYGNLRGIDGLSFTPDGKRLVALRHDSADVWDLVTKKQTALLLDDRQPGGDPTIIQAVTIAPKGDLIYTISGDWTVMEWDGKTGRRVHTRPGLTLLKKLETDKGFRTSKWMNRIGDATSSDMKVMALLDTEGRKVKLYDQATAAELAVVPLVKFRAYQMAMAPDAKTLAVSGWEDDLLEPLRTHIWDLTTKLKPKLLGKMQVGLPGSINQGRYLAFSPDGRLVVSARPTAIGGSAFNNDIKLFDVSRAQQVAAFQIKAEFSPKIAHVGFSPDSKILLVGCDDVKVRIWDVAGLIGAK